MSLDEPFVLLIPPMLLGPAVDWCAVMLYTQGVEIIERQLADSAESPGDASRVALGLPVSRAVSAAAQVWLARRGFTINEEVVVVDEQAWPGVPVRTLVGEGVGPWLTQRYREEFTAYARRQSSEPPETAGHHDGAP